MVDIKCSLLLLTSIILLSCNHDNKKSTATETSNKKLASYKNVNLYAKDLIEQSAYASLDSGEVNHSAINDWLINQILISEAKSIITVEDIEPLVEDYRNSLYVHYYESKILSEKLDSNITDNELLQFYQSNKSEYKLDDTYCRILLMRVPKSEKTDKNITEWMKSINSTNLYQLKKYADNYADIAMLSPDTWVKWDAVQAVVPNKFINKNNIIPKVVREFADFKHTYYIHILDVLKPNQEPPLSYIKEKATFSILHQRKVQFLDNIKRQLYDKELKNKNITIY